MDSAPIPPNVEESTDPEESITKSCPHCGAILYPLEGQFRCLQCQFTFCVACEGLAG